MQAASSTMSWPTGPILVMIRPAMTHASGQLDDVVAHRPDPRDDSPGDAAHEFSIPRSSSFVYGMRELFLLQDLDGEKLGQFL